MVALLRDPAAAAGGSGLVSMARFGITVVVIVVLALIVFFATRRRK